MTEPRHGAGDPGPGDATPGPSSFPDRRRLPRRPLAFPGLDKRRRELGSSSAGPVSDPAADPLADPVPDPSAGSIPDPSAGSVPGPVGRSVSGPVGGSGSQVARPPRSAVDAADPSSPPAELRDIAAQLFGERLRQAQDYARLLVTDGVVRGLIGPREASRIWERHLLNCGVVSELIPIGASLVDVGSGAGLPGIVLAVARPDLSVTLVEPLARRTAFLSEAVTALGLAATVQVVRGRAEDVVDGPPAGADVVTARAVAALDRLAGWCLPLARVGGRLLALKGASAADEIAEHRAAIAAAGGSEPVLRTCGTGLIEPPATVVEIAKVRDVVPAQSKPPVRAAASTRGRTTGRGRMRRG